MFNESNHVNNFTGNRGLPNAWVVHGVIWPVITSFGLIGNILSFIVLFRLSKSSSFYMFLACLAVSDFGVLCIGGVYFWLQRVGLYRTFKNRVELLCSTSYALLSVFSHLSSWITVAVTVDRYIAVCHPLKLHQFLNRKRALIYVGLTFLVIAGINFPDTCFQWNEDYSSCVVPKFLNEYCIKYNNYIGMSVYFLVPFFIIFIFNVLILRGIWAAARKRRNMTSGNGGNSTEVKTSTLRTIAMLLTITSFFIVSFIPNLGISLYGLINNKRWDEVITIHPAFNIIVVIGNQLNHSVNFILYGLSGQRFREIFAEIFCHQRLIQR